MKTALIALAALAAAGPALAQTGSGTMGTERGPRLQMGQSKQNDPAHTEREAGKGTTLDAGQMALAGLATVSVPPELAAAEFDLAVSLCEVAFGRRLGSAVAADLDQVRRVYQLRQAGDLAEASSYRIDDLLKFGAVDKGDDFARLLRSPEPPNVRPQVGPGNYRVVAVNVEPGIVEIEMNGKRSSWRPAETSPPQSVQGLVEPPERKTLIDRAQARWAALTADPAAVPCIGALARRSVVAPMSVWPGGFSGVTVEWVVTQTAAVLGLSEMAAAVADKMQATAFRSQSVAIETASALAAEMAPAWIAPLKARFESAEVGKYQVDLTGKCGHGWSVALPDGLTYWLCGSGSGFDVMLAGSPWLGQGWIAGSKMDLTVGERGAATMAEAKQAIKKAGMTWGQRVGAALGFGTQ